jgi:PAS domain S-box-containing protein
VHNAAVFSPLASIRSRFRSRGVLQLLAPGLALLAGVCLTVLAVLLLRAAEDREAQLQFVSLSQPIRQDIETRIHTYWVVARSAAGLVEVSPDPSGVVWLDYVAKVDPERTWQGFRGMALGLAVTPDAEDAFVRRRRETGQPDFRIWRNPGVAAGSGLRMPLTFIAPGTTRNNAVIGFDLMSDPPRAHAIEAARDSGEPRFTEPLVLLNDAGQRENSVLLVSPVYRNANPTILDWRRDSFSGVVVIGVGITHIVERVLAGPEQKRVGLRITDIGSGKPVAGVAGAVPAGTSRHSHITKLQVGGRDWLLEFVSTPEYDAMTDRRRSQIVSVGGVIVTLLLTAAIYYQGRHRLRAERLALEMTADLRDSETRFRLVAEAAGEGIWEQDFRRGTEFISPRLWQGILGYSQSMTQPLGKFGDLLHPEDRERWREARRLHLERGAPYEVEYRVKHADGRWIWVRSRGQAQFDAAGKPLLMVGSMSDISERKQQEEALKRERSFLHEILDTLPLPVAVKRPAAEILIANRAYAEWVGWPLDAVIGGTAYDYLPKDVVDAAVELDRLVLADGGMRAVEVTYPDVRREGALRHVVISKMRCRGPDGETLIVAMHQDVTDLRVSEARFRELTSMASDWFWEQDADFRFSEMSSGIRTGGRRPVNLIGKYRWDLPIDWTPEQWANHRAVLEAHQPFTKLEYRVRDEAGNWRWYSITGTPRFDARGRFVGYRGTGSDITERKTVEEELRQHRDNLAAMVEQRTLELQRAKEAAETASRTKSEFLANMSHELRTPLHAILSFANMGKAKAHGATPEKVQGWFGKIHASGNRLLHLVNEVLDLSKLEAGKMVLHLQPTDLVALVREAAEELEPLAESRQVRFDLPPVESRIVAEVDHGRFTQVVHNLYSNAIKFSPANSIVTVEITEATMSSGRRVSDQSAQMPAWRLAVLDEGVGIPEDELDAIFDKFVQSTKTRTGAGGTGLGLAICREIVDAHRGTIRAYNRPAGGTVLEILIPRSEPT